MASADIGLIGLAVMGQNLVLNMNDHGFTVAVFNRTTSKVDQFLDNEAKGTKIVGAKTIEEFIKLLKKPRIVMLLVKAGSAVDDFIAKLVPFLDKDDIIIDGGNSEFLDTKRRCEELEAKGLLYVGSGVSGGEEGARSGPSLMPGGNPNAWPKIKPIFEAIAAKASGTPCVDWTGPSGSGHFVKMVHNGIEYGDMQLISEAYQLMRDYVHMSNDEISKTFKEWNTGELESYLIEITGDIMAFKEPNGKYVVDDILDTAGQKGTGKWTAMGGLEYGTPITLIAEAVFARLLSSMRETRLHSAKVLPGPSTKEQKLSDAEKKEFVEHIRQALFASKVISYTQGFMFLQKAEEIFGWKLNLGAIALMWRGGCIIRSQFLGKISDAFKANPKLEHLLLDSYFSGVVRDCQNGWRKVIAGSALNGIPTPAFSSALAFYDGLRCARLPANLLQAQRDYFGAHQFQRVSDPKNWVHIDWTGHGGSAASTTYQV